MSTVRDESLRGQETPADRALSLLISGDCEQALRCIIPELEVDPFSVQSLLIASIVLSKLKRKDVAGEGFRETVQRAMRSGQLALAVAGCIQAKKLKADVETALDEIAQSYSRESPLLTDAIIPPVLHSARASINPLPAGVGGERLLSRAEDALFKAVALSEQERAQSPPQQLAKQPLFSALSSDGLRLTLGAFDIDTVPAGSVLIRQGDPGDSAFVLARGELEVVRSEDGQVPALLARLGAGCLFGEMALLSRAPRSASVVARRPSIVLSAQRSTLDELAHIKPEIGHVLAEFCRKRMLQNLTRTSPVLSELPFSERARVVEHFTPRTVESGEYLIRQGEPAEGLFLLASGWVKVVHRDLEDATVVAQLSAGQLVGEVSAVLRRPSNADVVAGCPSVALCLPTTDLLKLVRQHPRLLLALYELAVAREVETDYLARQAASPVDDSVLV